MTRDMLAPDEPPRPPQSGGFGRALKHNAGKLCALGRWPSVRATAPHNLRYVQVPADSVRVLIQHGIRDRTG